MHDPVIADIIELLHRCRDGGLLDFIRKLLQKSL